MFFAAKIYQYPTNARETQIFIVSYTSSELSSGYQHQAKQRHRVDVILFRFVTHILFHLCTTLYRTIKINQQNVMMNTTTRKTIFSKGTKKEFTLIVEAEEDDDHQDEDQHSHSHSQRRKSRSWSLKKRIIGGSGSSGSGSSTSSKEYKNKKNNNDNVKMISKLRDSFRRKKAKKHKHIDRDGSDDNNDDDESKSSSVTTLLFTKATIRVLPMNTSCEITLIDLTNDVTHDMSDTTYSASDLQLFQDDDASSSNSYNKIMPPLSSGHTAGGADYFTTNLKGNDGNSSNNNNEGIMDDDVGDGGGDVQQYHARQPQQQQQQQRNHSNFVINKDSELYESLFIASSSDEDDDDDDDNEIFNEYYINKDIIDYDDDDVIPTNDKILNITIDTVELADDEEYQFDENAYQSYEDGINFKEYGEFPQEIIVRSSC